MGLPGDVLGTVRAIRVPAGASQQSEHESSRMFVDRSCSSFFGLKCNNNTSSYQRMRNLKIVLIYSILAILFSVQ